MMIVADKDVSLVLTGTGDVLEPEHGVMAIGSGGNYALAAARALTDTDKDAETIVRRALDIAADICVYTNRNVTIETLTAWAPRQTKRLRLQGRGCRRARDWSSRQDCFSCRRRSSTAWADCRSAPADTSSSGTAWCWVRRTPSTSPIGTPSRTLFTASCSMPRHGWCCRASRGSRAFWLRCWSKAAGSCWRIRRSLSSVIAPAPSRWIITGTASLTRCPTHWRWSRASSLQENYQWSQPWCWRLFSRSPSACTSATTWRWTSSCWFIRSMPYGSGRADRRLSRPLAEPLAVHAIRQ